MLQSVHLSVCRGLAARGLSYVAQARQLQRLKEEDSYCAHQLQLGHFLLYSRGRPLLLQTSRQPLWLDYEHAVRLTPDLDQSCVLLGVSSDGCPQLAANAGRVGGSLVV